VRQARLLIGGIVVALVATAAAMGSPTEPRRAARIAAAQAGCGSLGAAADFTVFSDGVFDASKGSGTSVSGRIAAAGDVTLDAISVGPAPGDGPPTVVTGANFHGGRPGGSGGTLNGGVRARGTIDQAPNFTINGTQEPHTAPGFSFADEFAALAALSDLWGSQPATPGATAALNIYSHALELHGPADGLNVFHVGAADLAAAAGIVITLDKPGATALIDVSTDTVLTVSAQYLNLSANVSADRLVWNLPLASGLNVTHGIAFKGLILAPHATVTSAGHPQLDGQLIAADVPGSEWVLRRAAFSGCLPAPTPPDTTLTLGPRCIDGAGNLTMRLRNTGDHVRDVRWDDLNGPSSAPSASRPATTTSSTSRTGTRAA